MKNQRPCPCQEFLSPRETQQIRKRPAENSLKWGFIFVPHEKKGFDILCLLQKPYIFLTESWVRFQCVFNALQTILHFTLPRSPATGRAEFFIYIS